MQEETSSEMISSPLRFREVSAESTLLHLLLSCRTHDLVSDCHLCPVLVEVRRGRSRRVRLESPLPPFIEVQLIFQHLREPWLEAEPLDVWLMDNAENSEC